MKLLIVDDDPQIRALVKTYGSMEGYYCTEAPDGDEALEKLTQDSFDLIILDVMMPKKSGYETLADLRDRRIATPVILLTARTEEYDKLMGFKLGADDYLTKPFSPKELMARVQAVVKRSNGQIFESHMLTVEGVQVNELSRTVKVDEQEVSLTPKEYELLVFFVKNPNQAFSRDQLLNKVWGYDFYGDARTVDTHIKSLRERLGPYRKMISTVWGVGYRFTYVPQKREVEQ